MALFIIRFIQAQSIEDIEQLKRLKEQLDQSGKLTEDDKKKLEQVKSLETFREQLSQPPRAVRADSVTHIETAVIKESKPEAATGLPYFGFDIFNNARIDFSPEIYGPVDEDYPLGPGDEIVITVWGEVELRHELFVNRQGQIFIPEVGVVQLIGLTMRQAKTKLTEALSRSYSSISSKKAYLDVSAGKLRSIKLYVVGDVKNPGVFTVPALSSVFSMLFYAGGVKETASLRDIYVVREDKAFVHLDFYEFIRSGNTFANIRLQNHDVIVIPTVKNRVKLSGSVLKPAIYELKADEGIIKLLEYAGGPKEDAYLKNILVDRFTDNRDHKLFEINFDSLRRSSSDFPLQNGDAITVSSLNRELKNYVNIDGPIFGPTRFEYFRGMTIKDLFARVDSISGIAYLERVHITRTLADKKKQVFSINLLDFFNHAEQDFLLAPEDHIRINSRNLLFPADSVSIYGSVNRPGKYLLKKDMTLKDLIFSAGGFSRDARINEAEVSRINPKHTSSNKLADILYVPIDSNYTKALEPGKGELFFLEAFDEVFIRTNSDWELQRNVIVDGEVENPGLYSLKNKTERITDLIARAGGLKETAYIEGATLFRSKEGAGQIGVDFRKIFKNPKSEENLFLNDGDRIVIPERLATVKVIGGVNFPSSVLYEKGKSMDYYIKAAGGYVKLADKENTTVRLANGKPIAQKQFLFWKYLPGDITAGSTIFIPILVDEDKIDWSGAIRDAAAILSSVATVILIVNQFK
jgi:protein involved in polysaccharide export with SLBB domain